MIVLRCVVLENFSFHILIRTHFWGSHTNGEDPHLVQYGDLRIYLVYIVNISEELTVPIFCPVLLELSRKQKLSYSETLLTIHQFIPRHASQHGTLYP